ncbi:uncharacterized mitochondrial protein AtMg00810-like [Vigna angularis]|uniref:uncharacterized mitochondrial protein AtMg00810-like n=1 Tax=Phaseolus angularis TaxID=3914 RepID=UPI0022B3C980|nr:uncharacterized mitochondrial protein AtMg00810-like [Vigna angularis]
MLVTGNSKTGIEEFKIRMRAEYDMTDLGKLNYFLGLEFIKTTSGVFLHQKRFISEILKRFNMTECNSTTVPITTNLKLTNQLDEKGVDASLYKQIVGSLRYICNNRPNINYGVGLLSRFMNEPKQSHMSVAKHVLRYLKRTIDYDILFPKAVSNLESTLEVWSDSD